MPYIACMLGGVVSTPGPIDICKTPPRGVPGPFMNVGLWETTEDFIPEVLINSSPSCAVGTIIYISNLDQAGTLLGVISQTIMAIHTALTGLINVIMNGSPACILGITITFANDINTVAIYDIPAQLDVKGL